MIEFNYFVMGKKYYLTIYDHNRIIKEFKDLTKKSFDKIYNKYYNNGYMIKLKNYF
jgi:hypothetical protein